MANGVDPLIAAMAARLDTHGDELLELAKAVSSMEATLREVHDDVGSITEAKDVLVADHVIVHRTESNVKCLLIYKSKSAVVIAVLCVLVLGYGGCNLVPMVI